MVLNKVLWKDNLIEIIKTWPRFLSIFLISLLGVGFFVGIRATSPSMIKTAQTFYDDHQLPIGRLQSTYGIRQEDLEILDAAGLEYDALKTLDATLQPMSQRVTVYPYREGRDYFFLTQGEFPTQPDQIALDILYQDQGIKIGDQVSLETTIETDDGEDELKAPYLSRTNFQVVGFVDSSLYYSKISRGFPGIRGFTLVSDKVIQGDFDTQVLFWLDQALVAYDPEAEKAIDQQVDYLQEQFDQAAPQRLAQLKEEGQEMIDQGWQDVNEGYDQLDQAKQELADAKEKLDKGQVAYDQASEELEKARQQVEQGQSDLSQGQINVQAGWNQLESQEAVLANQEQAYTQGYQDYIAGVESFNQVINLGRNQLLDHQASLNQAKNQLDQAKQELDMGRESLANGQSQLDQQVQAINQELDQAIANRQEQLAAFVQEANQENSMITNAQEVRSAQGDELRLTLLYLQDQLNQLDLQAQAVNDGMAQAELGMEEAQAALDSLNGQIVSMEQEAQILSDQRLGLDDQMAALTTQEESLASDQALWQEEINRLTGEMTQVQATISNNPDLANDQATLDLISDLENQLSQAQANEDQISLEYDKIKGQIAILSEQLLGLSSQLDQLSQALTQARQQVVDLQEQFDQMHQVLSSGPGQVQQIDQAKQELEEMINQLQEGLTLLSQAQEELNQNRQDLDQGQADYEQGLKTYQEGLMAYQTGQAEFQEGQTQGQAELQQALDQLNTARGQLNSGWQAILTGRDDLARAQSQIDQEGQTLAQAVADIKAGEERLAKELMALQEGQKEYEEALASYNKEEESALADLSHAEQDLAEAQKSLDNLSDPIYYVTDRSGFDAYDTLYDNAMQIKEISQVFPLFFFAIAILVTFTTIKRMVSEQRNYLGTLKQMGYPNRAILSKFVTYAGLAALLGVLVGIPLGYLIFPPVIMNAYNNIFHFDQIQVVQSMGINVSVAAITLACALIPAIWTPLQMLRTQPARLLLPEPPKAGKAILMERMAFLWRLFTFNQKMTLRNLFRYKGRNAMTLVGVAGCTMLIVTGFGISDTIEDFIDIQYEQIQTYDAVVSLTDNVEDSDIQRIIAYDGIEGVRHIHQETWQTDLAKANLGITVMVAEEDLNGFLNLYPRGHAERVDLNQGVYLTERMAEYAGIGPGDNFTIQDQGKKVTLVIDGIVENYIGHYLYMGPDLYQQYFGKQVTTNGLLAKFSPQVDVTNLEKELSEDAGVQAIVTLSSISEKVQKTMSSLGLITVVLVVSAATLAFIVLYNLTNINISERMRELSTIKVLGFYNREVSVYIFDEIVILTFIGGLLGCLLGTLLNTYILKTIQMPDLFFYPQVKWPSYLISMVLTFIFASVVMVFMHHKITKINMVEALKAQD